MASLSTDDLVPQMRAQTSSQMGQMGTQMGQSGPKMGQMGAPLGARMGPQGIGEGSYRMHVGGEEGAQKVSRTGREHDLLPGGQYVTDTGAGTVQGGQGDGVSDDFLLGSPARTGNDVNVRRSVDDKGRTWELERLRYGTRQQHTSVTVTHSPPR